ncbi:MULTISPECIES: MarR family winged helix-turn-helix transcriptional regulator [unclassified Sphingomonas]|uniref:MarR family winged helix-turn-helix transcriptional regulator n=1 Tax=unclassified Sphingomonas TaxID=196159 RepID=UPI00226A0216|nr:MULTISPECIES: MarR family winged helix-turn-helix transcriptional regulator [unclassified Sphingomonas]
MLETAGVEDRVLEAALPRLDGYASALDLQMVVTLAEPQIDLVTRHLLGGRVQLLCAPGLGDRVAALALAAQASGSVALHDSWRETESMRLQRLNQEVARIAEILARLTRSETPVPGSEIEDRRRSYDPGPGKLPSLEPQDVRRTIRARRIRDQFFAAGLFEDPAWDMLLDLFAAELEGVRVSVSSLCIAAAVAPTTALRWITKMSDMGLFLRQPDPQDRRRAFMALSAQASEAMRGYMVAAKRGELVAV